MKPLNTLSRKRILSIIFQIFFLVFVVWAVSLWQTRNLVPVDSPAPDFTLRSLDGKDYTLSQDRGKKIILYFFSPYCRICKYSSDNIVALRNARKPGELQMYALALSWDNVEEIKKFAHDHKLNVPVIPAGQDIARAYSISAFPTIYIIDERGMIKDRMVGYTTEIGLRLRSL